MGLFWGENPKSAGLWLRLEEEGAAAPAPAAVAVAAGSRRQMSVRREAGGAGWGSRARASLRPKPGGGYTMPPPGRVSRTFCLTALFCAGTTEAFLVCVLVACLLCLSCADADAGQHAARPEGGRGFLRAWCSCAAGAVSERNI